MAEFTLRPMVSTDGPAIDALIREEAQTTSISMTTSYRHDVYQSLLAQHPSLFGVVAEAPGVDGLAGFATAFVDGVTVAGRPYPTAHLENLRSALTSTGAAPAWPRRIAGRSGSERGGDGRDRFELCGLGRDRPALGEPTRGPVSLRIARPSTPAEAA
jgi:hypothetical protein